MSERPIPGFDGYTITDNGEVFSTKRGGRHRMRTHKSKYGYLHLSLSCGERLITKKIHALVALAFIGPRQPGMQINHIDGNKTNNHVSNLEYVTRQQNHTHALANGLHVHGERSYAAKLTRKAVADILSQRHWCPLMAVELARKYRVRSDVATLGGTTLQRSAPSLARRGWGDE